MGRFSFDMPDDFINQLEKLSNFDEVAKKMLNAAAPILVGTLKHEVARFDTYSQDGSLYNSITASRPKKNKYGYFVTIGPRKGSVNERGVRNGEVLAYLEYGTSKMTAKPMLDRAGKAAESRIIAVMTEVFNEEVGK